jgi:broad specificity phosphatase PhoE
VPAILLARHGQASFGAADYDVLSELGARQAHALAAHLSARGIVVDRLISGSLRRQADTAAPIAAATGVRVETDARWDEYTGDDLLAAHADVPVRLEHSDDDTPRMTSREFQAILEDGLATWIDAGDASSADESWPAFAGRVRGALTDLAASLGSGETALVVTSGGVLGAVCARLLGAPDHAFITLNRVMINAGLTKVISGAGGLTLVSVNEHAHLESADGTLVTYR